MPVPRYIIDSAMTNANKPKRQPRDLWRDEVVGGILAYLVIAAAVGILLLCLLFGAERHERVQDIKTQRIQEKVALCERN